MVLCSSLVPKISDIIPPKLMTIRKLRINLALRGRLRNFSNGFLKGILRNRRTNFSYYYTINKIKINSRENLFFQKTLDKEFKIYDSSQNQQLTEKSIISRKEGSFVLFQLSVLSALNCTIWCHGGILVTLSCV